MEPALRRRRAHRSRVRLAGARHARLGLGRVARGGRARVRSRQRDRARAPTRRPDRRCGVRGPRRRRSSRRRGGPRGRSLRPRDGVRRHHPLACARLRPRQRARAGSRLHGKRGGSPGRAPVGGRAGLRPREHEPLDDEEPVRGPAPRARGHRLLPADGSDRLGAQHAGRELSVALLLSRLGRKPREPGPARASSTTRALRSSSSRAGSTSRWRGSAARGSWSPGTASPPPT